MRDLSMSTSKQGAPVQEMQSTVVEELERLVPGRVHLPGASAYVGATAVWNGAITVRPVVVAQPETPDEVQAVVRLAREHGLPVTVRGGGHDWAGRALNEDGLVLDLSAMRAVRVDPSAREAVIEGGATADDVVRAAESYGLTAATGTVGDVGMVGFTLGGGYGPLNGIAGLGVDNLIEAQVVLADGQMVTTDATHEPELFWALRGGGGNFGVATQIRVRLHAVATLTTGVLLFPWQQAAAVLHRYDALVPSMPDQLTVQSGVISGPDGHPTVFLAPTWAGDPAGAMRWIDEVRRLGNPVVDEVAAMPPSVQLHLLDAFVARGNHYEMRTVNVAGLSAGAIDALVDAGSRRTSPLSAVSIHHFHGASTRISVADTAFGIRSPHYMVEILAAWEPGDGAPHRKWAQSLYDELRAHALPGGYPNLIGPGQQSQADMAYGPNVERLLTIKDRWDSTNTFAATMLPQRK